MQISKRSRQLRLKSLVMAALVVVDFQIQRTSSYCSGHPTASGRDERYPIRQPPSSPDRVCNVFSSRITSNMFSNANLLRRHGQNYEGRIDQDAMHPIEVIPRMQASVKKE